MAPKSEAGSAFSRRQVLQAGGAVSGMGLLSALLAACGGSDSDASSAAAGDPNKPAKLTNVEHDNRPLDIAAYQAVYTEFHKKYPNITIDFTTIPWETSEQKMLTLGQGKSLPNVGRMAYPADYAAADLVLPLDDMVSAADRARYTKQALDTYSAQGADGKVHLYGMPWFAGATAVMVNKTLVEQAGATLPADWTTEEFAQIAKATTVKGKHWGVTLDGSGIGDPAQIAMMAVYSFGGKWVNGDPTGTTPEPIVFNSPETVAGLQWYIDLYRSGSAIPSAPSDTYQQRDANFLAGKAAIAWQGPWNITATEESFKKSGFELVSMPLPKGPGGAISVYGGGASGIYKSAKEQSVVPQSLEWVKFISSDEGQKLYCKTNGMIPASIAAQADPYWADNPLYAGYIKALKSTPTTYPLWATGIQTLVENNYLVPLLQGALQGKLSAADLAKQVQEKVVAGLKKNGVKVPGA